MGILRFQELVEGCCKKVWRNFFIHIYISIFSILFIYGFKPLFSVNSLEINPLTSTKLEDHLHMHSFLGSLPCQMIIGRQANDVFYFAPVYFHDNECVHPTWVLMYIYIYSNSEIDRKAGNLKTMEEPFSGIWLKHFSASFLDYNLSYRWGWRWAIIPKSANFSGS